MSNSGNPDGGCLSTLTCGLLSRREKRPPNVTQNASGTPTATVSKPTNSQSSPLSTPSPNPAPQKVCDIANGDSETHVLLSEKPTVKCAPVSEIGSALNNAAPAEANAQEDDAVISLELWTEAYEKVDEETRQWIEPVPAIENVRDFAQDLVKVVHNREEEYKGEKSDLEVGKEKRKILWRDHAERVVSWLTVVGDIAFPFAPAPSSAVWSGVKVLLNCKELVAILGCTDIVLCLIRRGRVYERVYLCKPSLTDLQTDLREKLVSMYTDCLDFLAHMHGKFNKNMAKQFLDALIDPKESTGKVAEMRDWEKKLSIVAEACGTESLQASSAEQKKLLQSLQEPLGRIDDRVVGVLQKLEESAADQALDFISTIPVGRHQTEKRDLRTENTCEWLISHPRFRQWEDASYSSLLWLQGNIGTGKSFLSSKVIDRYCVDRSEPDKWSNNHDDAFAYFYCSRSDPTRQNISSILASYVRQLSEIPRHPGSIHVSSCKLFKDMKSVQKTTELKLYKEVLFEMINSYPRTTLVLDALDECDFNTRRELAIFLKQLVVESKHLFKMFIASRPQNEIRHHLGSSQSSQMLVEISTSDNQSDIEKYVDVEWERFVNSPPFDIEESQDSLEKLVKDTLREKSAGMFRWTYLQWEQIKACRSNGAITERLTCLPETLSDAYDEIYKTLRGSERLMLQRAVRWVMCAQSPLDSCTLLSAIRLESEKTDGNSPLNKSDLVEKTLESVCRHLIVKDSQLGVWKFPHASVLEYFETERKDESWFRDAKAEVGICLIKCVIECSLHISSILPPVDIFFGPFWPYITALFLSGETDPDELSDPQHPLQIYALRNWFRHISDVPDGNPKTVDIAQALKQLLDDNPKEFSRDFTIFTHYTLHGQSSLVDDSITRKNHPAVPIIALGLHKVLRGWWDKDLDLSSGERPRGSHLLTIATTYGHADICKYLIERGCDLNADAERMEESAIGMAIRSGNVEIVKLLLDNGANPDRVIEGQSLLCLAIAPSNAAFELLSARCHNVNIRCTTDSENDHECKFGCALSAAAYNNDKKALKILLDKGADVNPRDLQDEFGSPLIAAINGWGRSCVPILISHGAKVNAQLKTGQFGTPLAAAASIGKLGIARILIANGAEVNGYIPFGRYANVLAAAILGYRPSLRMVKFLIEEKEFDLTAFPFVRPRYDERRWKNERRDVRRLLEDQVEIVRYLIRGYGMDVESLISIGVSPEAIEALGVDEIRVT